LPTLPNPMIKNLLMGANVIRWNNIYCMPLKRLVHIGVG